MPSPSMSLVELGPDDALFPAWCEVWAATERADRPDESPRPATDHVALGRQLVSPGGSRDGTHRGGNGGALAHGITRDRIMRRHGRGQVSGVGGGPGAGFA